MTGPNWDERYEHRDLPWDTGVPDPHLVELVESGSLARGRVLEIGCGTGTNAIWLASRGFDVLGIDISPRAIAQARAKLAGESARFEVRDLFDAAFSGTFELVLDRGVLHIFDEPSTQAKFAGRVAEMLSPGGVWLSLAGSTEGPARDHGPPRRSALELISAIEPVLEILELRATEFHANVPTPPRAWMLRARQRATPAQPSSRMSQ
jgi:2-polyprenyl-3-methyl-5-hydroxy-6-metoxy-1,4-benzoquinol methylase